MNNKIKNKCPKISIENALQLGEYYDRKRRKQTTIGKCARKKGIIQRRHDDRSRENREKHQTQQTIRNNNRTSNKQACVTWEKCHKCQVGWKWEWNVRFRTYCYKNERYKQVEKGRPPKTIGSRERQAARLELHSSDKKLQLFSSSSIPAKGIASRQPPFYMIQFIALPFSVSGHSIHQRQTSTLVPGYDRVCFLILWKGTIDITVESERGREIVNQVTGHRRRVGESSSKSFLFMNVSIERQLNLLSVNMCTRRKESNRRESDRTATWQQNR